MASLFLGLISWFAFAVLASAAEPASTNQTIEPPSAEAYVSPTNGMGSWIWEQTTTNNQTCHLWKTFEIPEGAKVAKARLVMTVDNEFTLYLDGRELGHGTEWRELFVFDLTPLLTPGKHVLAVNCYNGSFFAGMLFGLQIDLADGKNIEIKSDASWRVVPLEVTRWETQAEAGPDWTNTTVIAPLGGTPWWTDPAAVNMMPSLQPLKVFFWQTGWFQVTLLLVCGIVIVISLRLMAQLVLYRKERFLLERERARIARDIHDDIGARMTQLVLHGEVAQNELPADSEMRQQLDWICEEARGLLSTMDEILWAVNPQRDTLRDFAAYVCKYAQEFLAPTKIQCLFEVGPEISAAAFDLPLRRSLLMAIKETLNNAVKHSGATELRLQIRWQGQQLIVVVQDNGKGFDTAATKSERNGLTNMVQRMNQLGGHCVIASQPDKGCRVEFSVPLRRARRSFWNWIRNAKDSNETGSDRNGKSAQNHDPTQC
ncbi:MAG TPA: ATP-binding protein [Verrucomicrobiae bacterium]|nr:ATP-binding protein [Verrucomicrobiae bacterium]